MDHLPRQRVLIGLATWLASMLYVCGAMRPLVSASCAGLRCLDPEESRARPGLPRLDFTSRPDGGKAFFWLQRAATALDCAVQCCGTDEYVEIDAMEERCDALAAALKVKGN